jgi:hypothetical protein
MTERCPRCGQPLLGGYRFCRACGLDVGGSPMAAMPPAQVPAYSPITAPLVGTPQPTNVLAVIGGVAWIISAALTGYLALLQFGFVGTILDGGSLQTLAISNGVAAALTVYFGIRCVMNPTRGFLSTMVAWGVLDVSWGLYQISGGVTHWAYLGAVVASGVAGLVCLAARAQAPVGRGRAPAATYQG